MNLHFAVYTAILALYTAYESTFCRILPPETSNGRMDSLRVVYVVVGPSVGGYHEP
jgi:hypothetical protein